MRHSFVALVVVLAIGLAAPARSTAQSFKVEKFDIKGDGGTDYVGGAFFRASGH